MMTFLMNILNRKDFKVVFWQVSVFLFLKLDFFVRGLSDQMSGGPKISQTLYESFWYKKLNVESLIYETRERCEACTIASEKKNVYTK